MARATMMVLLFRVRVLETKPVHSGLHRVFRSYRLMEKMMLVGAMGALLSKVVPGRRASANLALLLSQSYLSVRLGVTFRLLGAILRSGVSIL